MLICMCGVAGSGKSTKAKELAKWYNAVIVSTDAIREELFGDASIQKNNKKVFEIAFARVAEALQNGKAVIFDATNLTIKDRAKVLEIGEKWNRGFNVIYVMTASIDECKKRNSERERKVPDTAIEKQFKKYTAPTRAEGWDIIRQF